MFKQVIWGGSRMRDEYGYDIPGDDTGECWAISAHRNGDCVISGGEYEGRTLSWLWKNRPELFGRKADDGKVFPLLVKIIDAKQDLSIQVHPDDRYAAEHENGSSGKTECWYILDCDPGATIIIGHNARTKEELESMINKGDWNGFIREIPVKKGDFLQIYPGTVHAIKGGTMILETQQNSDLTYRVYDYDRVWNGSPRQLHIQQSIDVIGVPFTGSEARDKGEPLRRLDEGTDTDTGAASCEPLIRCDYYQVWKLNVNGSARYAQDRPFMLCSVIDGEGRVSVDDRPVRKGDHFILTAECREVLFTGRLSLICSSI